jgi:RNA polymerase sigma factor (sigma-70 family)
MVRFTRWPVGDVTELLKKAADGDREAQEKLYRQTESELRKLALYWIKRKHANENEGIRTTDVIDRAFVRLMWKPPRDGWDHRGAFYAFVSRNIPRILIDLLGASPPPESLPDGGNLDDLPERARDLTLHTLLTLQQALEDLGRALTEMHRKVVELRFLGECTLDEVAEQLSISRDKVFRMSKMGLEYLREQLGPSFPDLGRFPKHANGE